MRDSHSAANIGIAMSATSLIVRFSLKKALIAGQIC
jgi:hypothetical protein